MNDQLVGFTFPFRIENGGISHCDGTQKIQQDVSQLLSTRLGERVMLRAYGGGIHHRLQDPNDNTLRLLIRREIELALRTYMPDVVLTAPIQLTANEEELHIVVEYAANPRDVVQRLALQVL